MPVILEMLHILALGLHYFVFTQEETSLTQNSVYSIKGDVEFCNVGNTASIPQQQKPSNACWHILHL